MVQNIEKKNSPILNPHPTAPIPTNAPLLTLEDVIDSQYLGESNTQYSEKQYYQNIYPDNISRLPTSISPNSPGYNYQHMNALYFLRQSRSYNQQSHLMMSPSSPQYPMQGITYPVTSGWNTVSVYAPYYSQPGNNPLDSEPSQRQITHLSLSDPLRSENFAPYSMPDSSSSTVYNSYPPTFTLNQQINHPIFPKPPSILPRILVTNDLDNLSELNSVDSVAINRRNIKKEAAESPPLDTSSTLHSPANFPPVTSPTKPKKERKPRSLSENPKPKAPRNPNTNPKAKTIACPHPGCNKVFSRLYNMRTHTEIHSPNRTKDHACPECGLAFSRRHDMYRHQRNIHSKNTTKN